MGRGVQPHEQSLTVCDMCCNVAMSAGLQVIVGDQSHTYVYEAGGASVLGGIPYNVVPNQANGEISLHDLEAAVRSAPSNAEFPIPCTPLMCIADVSPFCMPHLFVGFACQGKKLALMTPVTSSSCVVVCSVVQSTYRVLLMFIRHTGFS